MLGLCITGPQLGRRGQPRSEEAEIALATSFRRKSLSVCAVRGQAQVLLGRLEVIAPGGVIVETLTSFIS